MSQNPISSVSLPLLQGTLSSKAAERAPKESAESPMSLPNSLYKLFVPDTKNQLNKFLYERPNLAEDLLSLQTEKKAVGE